MIGRERQVRLAHRAAVLAPEAPPELAVNSTRALPSNVNGFAMLRRKHPTCFRSLLGQARVARRRFAQGLLWGCDSVKKPELTHALSLHVADPYAGSLIARLAYEARYSGAHQYRFESGSQLRDQERGCAASEAENQLWRSAATTRTTTIARSATFQYWPG
jgi:hypothetical protein